MYKSLIRPVLFLIDPEKVHHLVILVVKFLNIIPGVHRGMEHYCNDSGLQSSTTVAGLHFKSRVGLAAGFDKNADFFTDFSMFGFSFAEIGTVTPRPQSGNPKPRLFRLRKDTALINRMGFNNKGVDYAVQQLKKRKKGLIIGGNIGKNTDTPNGDAANDYAVCFSKLYDVVDYFTINVSCPNIAGMEKLQDIRSLREILGRIMDLRRQQALYKPVFLKISPDLTFSYIDEVLALGYEIGLDGIIATNTTTSREGLAENPDQIKKIGPGGMSGKPLTKRTAEIISYICKQSSCRMPVIGVGGILSVEDALCMVRSGAVLLQVYTGFVYEGPFLVRKINRALTKHFNSRMNGTISDASGSAK
jgi:dihydroorotate dehydrogenase